MASLPASDVGLEGPALAGASSPSSPLRIIFLGRRAGGGVLLVEVLMLDNGGGTRQNGVLKIRTKPESKEWVMW